MATIINDKINQDNFFLVPLLAQENTFLHTDQATGSFGDAHSRGTRQFACITVVYRHIGSRSQFFNRRLAAEASHQRPYRKLWDRHAQLFLLCLATLSMHTAITAGAWSKTFFSLIGKASMSARRTMPGPRHLPGNDHFLYRSGYPARPPQKELPDLHRFGSKNTRQGRPRKEMRSPGYIRSRPGPTAQRCGRK